MQSEGNLTFLAGEALAIRRQVKIVTPVTTSPPSVVYADAGEYGIGITQIPAASGDSITVKPFNAPGSFEMEASEAINAGVAVYSANDGKISDTAVGTSIGVTKQAATGSGHRVEIIISPFLATTAAAVSVADAGLFFAGATAEAITQELGQNMATAQHLIAPILIIEEAGMPLAIFADGADPSPGLTQLASKGPAIRWNNHATPDAITVLFPVPPDLDDAADVIVHFQGAIVKAGGAEVDSPVLTVGAYFDVPGAAPGADVNCGGESGEFLTAAVAAWQEKTLTIAAADVPAAPGFLSLIINPKDGQLGTDDFVLLPPWLEVTRKKLTA